MDVGDLRPRQVNDDEDDQVQMLSNSNVQVDTNCRCFYRQIFGSWGTPLGAKNNQRWRRGLYWFGPPGSG